MIYWVTVGLVEAEASVEDLAWAGVEEEDSELELDSELIPSLMADGLVTCSGEAIHLTHICFQGRDKASTHSNRSKSSL